MKTDGINILQCKARHTRTIIGYNLIEIADKFSPNILYNYKKKNI